MGDFPVAALVGALGLISAVAMFFFGRQDGRNREVGDQRRAKATAEETASRILDEARREAETARKSAIVEGKEEILQLRESLEKEMRDRRVDVERDEKRVLDRETQMDRAREALEGRETDIQQRINELAKRDARLVEREKDVDEWGAFIGMSWARLGAAWTAAGEREKSRAAFANARRWLDMAMAARLDPMREGHYLDYASAYAVLLLRPVQVSGPPLVRRKMSQ